MTQWALADSDISKTNWVEGAGDTDADAFDELDEGFGAGRGSGAGPDDITTYWRSTSMATAGETRTIECGLTNVTDPALSTGHVVRGRICKSAGGGLGVEGIIYLYQGTTLIATSATEVLTATWVTVTINLSGAEADSITDYSDLRIRLICTAIGSGASRTGRISAKEFECPDVAAGVAGFPPIPAQIHRIRKNPVYRM